MLEPADQGADHREMRFSQKSSAAWEKISGGTREAGNKPCIIVVVAV